MWAFESSFRLQGQKARATRDFYKMSATPDGKPTEALPWQGNVLASTDVKEYWYAVSTSAQLTADRPHPVRVLGEPLALFRDEKKVARAFADRCPHKNVKLSDGKMNKGTLECFYHGWTFDSTSGAVTKVPALPSDCQLPKQCVKTFPCIEKNDIIWVYPGNPANADPKKIHSRPIQTDYKKKGFWRNETVIDLPCDHSYFVENLMDIAHTPWAHDGCFNHREDAVPLKPQFHMTPSGMHGFLEKVLNNGNPNSLEFEWTAPCTNEVIVRKTGHKDCIHLFFYSLPTAPGQMRHINITYMNILWFLQYIPRTLLPASQSDLAVIHGDTVAMMSQARNMKEGCPHITVATPSDEMAIKCLACLCSLYLDPLSTLSIYPK